MVSPVDPQCYGNFTRTDKFSLIRRSRGNRGLSGEDAARNGHTRAPKKVASRESLGLSRFVLSSFHDPLL